MPINNTYSVKKNRLDRSFFEGFAADEDGVLKSLPDSLFRTAVIYPFEGTEEQALWGRLSFDLSLDDETVLTIWTVASDDGGLTKLDELKKAGAGRHINCDDILLYELKGRFLYVGFEVEGVGQAEISRIKVDAEGDIFMASLPEIYRERGSFFHRYLSIFSSAYTDIQDEIDSLPKLLDPDICPADLLPVYASWMGIEIGPDLCDEATERELVKQLFSLTKQKGTADVIRKLCRIILGEDVRIIEHNILGGKRRIQNSAGEVFGPYDVEIQIRKNLDETTHYQLMYLLNQFKPIRVQLKITELDDEAKMDSSSYLDRNAVIPEDKSMVLDEGIRIGGVIKLDE